MRIICAFMKTRKMCLVLVFAVIITILYTMLTSCAVKYYTYREGGHDPLFDIGAVKTIGFTSFCPELDCDELTEKQFFVYAKDELQKRGYTVFYIPKQYLEYIETEKGFECHVKANYKDMPDLTLTIGFEQGLGNVVHVPGQSFGYAGWGNSSGSGYYSQTQGYSVQTYYLYLGYVLWSGQPKYMDVVWKGTLTKGSPKMNLQEQAQKMTKEIFRTKFKN